MTRPRSHIFTAIKPSADESTIIMNKIYRVIWNSALRCFMVTSELATGKTKAQRGPTVNVSALKIMATGALTLSALSSFTASATNGQLLVDGVAASYDNYRIATAGTSQSAIVISNGGDLTYNNTQATTSGAGAHNVLLQSGSTLNMNNVTMATLAGNTYGMMLSGNSSANLQNTTITLFGAGSVGIYATGSSQLTGSDITINSPYTGVLADNATMDFTNLNVTTSAARARGISVIGENSVVTVNGGSVTTSGSGAHAVYAGYNATVNVSNMEITTAAGGQAGAGGGAAALFADTYGKIQADNLTLNSSSNAIWLRASTFDGTNLQINQTSTVSGPAIWAFGDSILNLSNSDIALLGDRTQAIYIDGGLANLDNVTLHGDNGGNGLSVRYDGQLYGKNIDIAINNSYALPEDTFEYAGLTLSRGGGATFASLEDSRIVVNGDTAIGVLADIGVQNAELKNTLVAAEGTAVKVSSGASLALAVSGSTLTAPILLSGGMTAATPAAGNVYLDASDASSLNGNVVINRDTTNDSRLSLDTGSVWQGSATGLKTLNLSNNSQWNMTADSNVSDLNLADSTVTFNHESDSFKTLTVDGDFTSNNGTLVMNSVLANDGSAHDSLQVLGNTSGVTNVAINNAGGTGAQTIEGIEVISVAGDSAGEFKQQGRIVSGAYDYNLMRGVGSDAKNWYLISDMATVTPVDPVIPEKPVKAVDMITRPEAGSYLANMAAANNMFNLRLHDRGGETQYVDAITGEKKVTSLWMRNVGGHNTSTDSSGQLKTQTNRYVLQIGGDLGKVSFDGNDSLHFGTMAGYGNAQSNTDSKVTGYRSKGQVNGYSLGVYGTWYQNAEAKTGAYVDSWAQYNWFNNSVTGDGLPQESYKSKGMSASVEAGYSWKVGEDSAKNSYFIEPNAQFVWANIQADDVTENNGTRVTSQGSGNVQSRVGVRASMKTHSDKQQPVFQPYIEANWLNNSQNMGATMNDVSIQQHGSKNIAEVRAGVDGQLTQRVNLWGNVGQQMGSESYRDTSAMIGVKVSF